MEEERRGFLLESEGGERVGRGERAKSPRGGDGDEDGGIVGGGGRGGGEGREEVDGFDEVVDVDEGDNFSGDSVDRKDGRGRRTRRRGRRAGMSVGDGCVERLVGGRTEGHKRNKRDRGAHIVGPKGVPRERRESKKLPRSGSHQNNFMKTIGVGRRRRRGRGRRRKQMGIKLVVFREGGTRKRGKGGEVREDRIGHFPHFLLVLVQEKLNFLIQIIAIFKEKVTDILGEIDKKKNPILKTYKPKATSINL